MSSKEQKLYFPFSCPFHQCAKRWVRTKSYDDMEIEPGAGGISIVHCRFPAKNPEAAGKRLLFFSDLHCCKKNQAVLPHLCSEIIRLHPDILIAGGDLSAAACELRTMGEALEMLADTAPVRCAVLGNWERGKTWHKEEFWAHFFQSRRWNLLLNSALDCGFLKIYGVDDIGNGTPDIRGEFSRRQINILTAHRPDTVIALDHICKLAPFDLALCGHTHGGQVRLPLLGPIRASSFYGCKFAYGEFQRSGLNMKMLVSAGVNCGWFPLRLNCRREIVLLTFEECGTF